MWLIPKKEASTDCEKWEWLMEHYTPRMQKALFSEAMRLTESHEDAKDILQETLVRSATKCWQLRDEEKLFQWMITIVRNLCFDLKKQRFRAKLCALQLATGLLQSTVSLEDRAVTKEFTEKLYMLLEQLPSPEKEIIQMKAETDRSLKEIAQVLGLNYHTTRSKYNRTVKKLLRALR